MKSFAAVGIALALSSFVGNAAAVPIFGVTAASTLIVFDSNTPGVVSAPVPITGLGAGETIVGIDFRPANGALYGLGSGSRLYTINTATGVATPVGSAGAFTLNGTGFGFDFNPVPDRMRVTSNLDQNLRLNPNDGTLTATDGTLAYAAGDPNAGVNPQVVGSAYTNSFAGATTTTLYGIDSGLDILVTQNPPNNGTLNTVGPLGVNFGLQGGFDIFDPSDPFSPLAFAVFDPQINGISSNLYTINLATGAATLVGAVNSPLQIVAISIQQVPEPFSLALLGAGLIALGVTRRRARK